MLDEDRCHLRTGRVPRMRKAAVEINNISTMSSFGKSHDQFSILPCHFKPPARTCHRSMAVKRASWEPSVLVKLLPYRTMRNQTRAGTPLKHAGCCNLLLANKYRSAMCPLPSRLAKVDIAAFPKHDVFFPSPTPFTLLSTHPLSARWTGLPQIASPLSLNLLHLHSFNSLHHEPP